MYMSSSVQRVHICNLVGFGAGLSWISSLDGYHFPCRIVVYLAFKLDHLTKYESCIEFPCIFFSSILIKACIGMCGSTWQRCQANRLVIVGVTLSIGTTSVFFQSWSIIYEVKNFFEKWELYGKVFGYSICVNCIRTI